MPSKRKNLVFFQLALLIAILGIGAYATGYFWLGSRTDWKSKETGRLAVIERSYGSRWLATIFLPAGWVEQQVRRVEVDVRDDSSLKMIGS